MAKKSGKRAKKRNAEPEHLLEEVRGLRQLAAELLEQLQAAERSLLAHIGEASPVATPAAGRRTAAATTTTTSAPAPRRRGPAGTTASKAPARRTRRSSGNPSTGG